MAAACGSWSRMPVAFGDPARFFESPIIGCVRASAGLTLARRMRRIRKPTVDPRIQNVAGLASTDSHETARDPSRRPRARTACCVAPQTQTLATPRPQRCPQRQNSTHPSPPSTSIVPVYRPRLPATASRDAGEDAVAADHRDLEAPFRRPKSVLCRAALAHMLTRPGVRALAFARACARRIDGAPHARARAPASCRAFGLVAAPSRKHSGRSQIEGAECAGGVLRVPSFPRCFASGGNASESGDVQDAQSARLHSYPTEPRVGVGAVVLRRRASRAVDGASLPVEVLLIVRGKPPSEGLWSFPGGSLELGETVAACAVREVLEETGVEILAGRSEAAAPDLGGLAGNGDKEGEQGSRASSSRGQSAGANPHGASHLPTSEQQDLPFSLTPLLAPTSFTTRDVIERDADGKLWFHYLIVNVAASAVDADATPVPGDDARDARWVAVDDLESMRHECIEDLVEISKEAAARFWPVHPRGGGDQSRR